MNTELLSHDTSSIQSAARFLTKDEVVALPTETVYGLAGNAFSKTAVEKIFTAKERPSFDPLIVHVGLKMLQSGASYLESLIAAEIISSEVLSWPSKDQIESALKTFWPGPLSLVLPRGKKIPDAVTSGQPTVAVRCPSHPVFQAILNELTFPLAAPSANRFGRISPTDARHAWNELNGRIAAIVDGGPCTVGVESSIIRVENPLKVTLLRPGQVSGEELNRHFGIPVGVAQTIGQKNQAQLAPGMLDQHYAPRKPLILIPHSFEQIDETLKLLKEKNITGKIAFLGCKNVPNTLQGKHLVLSSSNSLEEMAKHLFAFLRTLDEDSSVDYIVADIPDGKEEGLKAAIVDRLNRASQNKPFLK